MSFARLVDPTATYHATVVAVTDGDTIRCDVTAGQVALAGLTLDVVARDIPVRLAGCNAWEAATEPGKAARGNLTRMLPPGTRVTLSSVVAYKYGMQLMASVALEDGRMLVPLLVAGQWAAPWSGRGIPPLPPWPRTV